MQIVNKPAKKNALAVLASLLMVDPQSCAPDTDTLKIAAGSSLPPYALRLNESESAKVHGSLLARIILERVGS
ncbi:MAG: hypothetical protein JWO52_6830 [Gammaproteobacteria bacterium]|nr:hypothetical protein [Gammaproteobacteria bacterium]